jgi:hypothetical protein
VRPEADRPDLELRRDGQVVGRAEWGAAIPVDPGGHVVEASAPGRARWQAHVDVSGPTAKVTVDVPALEPLPIEPAPSAAAPAAPVAPSSPSRAELEPSVVHDRHASWQRPAGLVIGGVGVAGVVAGAVLGVVAISKNNDAGTHCLGTVCDASGYSSGSSATQAATASTIAFIAGGVLAATGFVLLITSPSSSASARIALRPALGAGSGGGVLEGSW